MTARLIWDVSHVCGLTCFSSSKMKMMAVTSLTTSSVCVGTRVLGMPHKAVTFLKKKPRLMRLDTGEGRNENMTLEHGLAPLNALHEPAMMPWLSYRRNGCSLHWWTTTIKPLSDDVNNNDGLVNVWYSAGNAAVLVFHHTTNTSQELHNKEPRSSDLTSKTLQSPNPAENSWRDKS